MTDFLLPPDLGIAAATPNLDANTASFKSPTVGSTRSVERLGDALRFQFNFTTVNDDPAMKRQRGRLQAFLSSLRGQSGRVWMTPPGALLRGSFPATELLTNNDFSNGTSGWSAGTESALTALDRALRVKRIANIGGSNAFASQSISGLTLNVPYAFRAMIGTVSGTVNAGVSTSTFGSDAGAAPGFHIVSGASQATSTLAFADNIGNLLSKAGEYYDVAWTSFSRCALVDNSPNQILFSDQIDNAAWTPANITISGNAIGAPDGSATADAMVESGVTNVDHRITQAVTVSAATTNDFTFCGYVRPSRNFVILAMRESIGTTDAYACFNLATGVIGTLGTGTNWANVRAFIAPAGNSWYFCSVTARKTNAATSVSCFSNSATADNVFAYAGSSIVALYYWRMGFAQSSFPFNAAQTTGAAVAAALQSGTALNLKGLPLSSAGLLLPGDWFQCNSQLHQVIASLDSDAAGLGTAILARPPRNGPPENSAFVVNNPMGRFLVTSNSTGWNEMPGRMSDASLELVEDISF